MGSMAIAACVSQYASACSFKVSAPKLGVSNWTNPVVPTRSTSAEFPAAVAGVTTVAISAITNNDAAAARKILHLYLHLSPRHPYVAASRTPNLRVRGTKDREHRRSRGRRQMRNPAIVADVQVGARQEPAKLVQIADAHGFGQRGVVFSGAP